MAKQINSLQTLRGVAALLVALYHYPSSSYLYFKDGFLAVYFFFSLSGFVIALNYFNKIRDFNSLVQFQKKRFLRIYPIHIFALFVALSIQLVKLILLKFYNFNSANEAFYPSKLFGVTDFFQHIFLTQSVTNFGYFLSWNSASWAISAEFYAYLAFGILVLIVRNNKLIFITLAIIYILLIEIISSKLQIYINPVFLNCLFYFFNGCIVFFIYDKNKLRINDISFLSFLIILILWNKYYYLNNAIFYSTIIFLVLIIKESAFFYKVFNFYPFVYFGTISYSFYLLHQPILYLYIQTLKFIFNIDFNDKGGISTSIGIPYYDTLITVSYILTTLLLAVFTYRHIEKKFRI